MRLIRFRILEGLEQPLGECLEGWVSLGSRNDVGQVGSEEGAEATELKRSWFAHY